MIGQLKDWTEIEVTKREGMTRCSEDKALYMGHPLYPLSYQGALNS